MATKEEIYLPAKSIKKTKEMDGGCIVDIVGL